MSYTGGEEGTGGYELVAGVGAGGGQPEKSDRAKRSLRADQPSMTKVPPRGQARRYACKR
jgi:hypothetical protein